MYIITISDMAMTVIVNIGAIFMICIALVLRG